MKRGLQGIIDFTVHAQKMSLDTLPNSVIAVYRFTPEHLGRIEEQSSELVWLSSRPTHHLLCVVPVVSLNFHPNSIWPCRSVQGISVSRINKLTFRRFSSSDG